MRLATLRNGTRDGALVVVGPTGDRYATADDLAPTLQSALDRWDDVAPALHALSDALARNEGPLPRART
jgi:fumarylacetoacetate (FAA) hydrolase